MNKFAQANDLITVILPNNVSLRLDHCLNKFSDLFIIGAAFKSHISKTSVVIVTPKTLKGPCVQSS